MRPLDPRLLGRTRAIQPYLVLIAAAGAATAALIVVQATLLAGTIAAVAGGQGLAEQAPALTGLAVTVLARAGVAWLADRYAHRAATRVVAELRGQVVRHAVELGPAGLDGAGRAEVSTLATRGLDALEPYLTRYLPHLLLAALLPPALLVVIGRQDLIAALTIAATLPLVPLFMVLVGWTTQGHADRRLAALQRLGGRLMDLLAGLPTLVALGRERGPERQLLQLGRAHRLATMRVLRSAFLSGLVLELLTTLSVALVAVGVGLRLVSGGLDLRTGLIVIMLAPEVYLPLRMVGLHYHASVAGLAAAGQAFALLDRPGPDPMPATRPGPAGGFTGARMRGVVVRHPGRAAAAPDGVSLTVRPGRITALAGRSGSGKTTLIEVLLGLRRPYRGSVELLTADGRWTPLEPGADPAGWRACLSWGPQQALVIPGTLAENARLLSPGATDGELAAAAHRAGLDEVVARLPHGWDTRLGQGGLGLSAGQRQRLVLTRVLLRPSPVVVLDEPTAHLDPRTESLLLGTVRRLRDEGRAVLLVSHRRPLIAIADEVVGLPA